MVNSNMKGIITGETGDLRIQAQIYIGKNQPSAKLARFIHRLRRIASAKRNRFAGK